MECFEFGYVIKGDVNDTLKKTVEYCSDGIKQKAKVLAGYIVSTVRNTAINRLRVKEYEKDHIAEFIEENVSGADRYVPMETLLILAERRKAIEGYGGNVTAASAVGKLIAERALAKGIENVVFDRGGYLYHGRVQALAEGAREGGLEF